MRIVITSNGNEGDGDESGPEASGVFRGPPAGSRSARRLK
jgi:hypothetical protein